MLTRPKLASRSRLAGRRSAPATLTPHPLGACTLAQARALESTQASAEEREVAAKRLQQWLLAQQRIYQVCLQEGDPADLLQSAAEILAKQGGYDGVWIARFDGESTRSTWIARAGSVHDHSSSALCQLLGQGKLPGCFHQALLQDGTFVRPSPRSHCADCPLGATHASRCVFSHRLAVGLRTYGMILALPRPDQALLAEESQLFSTIAGALAFALRNLEAKAALHLAKRQAEEANRAKTAFLASMCHELRTPLNAMLGFSHLVRREPGLPEPAAGHLDLINRSGEHLRHILNDVLDLSRIEAGEQSVELGPVEVDARLADIAALLQGRARDRGITLAVSSDCPYPILTDATKLRHILFNLVGNALKFTPHGSVTLRARLSREPAPRGLRLHLEVEDTGVGIDRDSLPRIFEPFHALASDGGEPGTGLGLSITRRYVDLLQGEISVESAPGRGSCFRVELPVEPAPVAPAPPPAVAEQEPAPAATASSRRVLIVEDEYANALMLRHTLEHAGFEVRLAPNGSLGVEAVQAWSPHLVWMDIMMPVMDGKAATRAIRALPSGGDTTIIALTACAFDQERAEILEAGCDECLNKPIHPEEILACMRRHRHGRSSSSPLISVPTAPPALEVLTEDQRRPLLKALLSLDADQIRSAVGTLRPVAPVLAGVLGGHVERLNYTALYQALQSSRSSLP